MEYRAVVIGASAGGLNALRTILTGLDAGFSMPLLVTQHISAHSDNYMTVHLNSLCKMTVKEADEKEKIEKGKAYFAPPNFHMLVEEDYSISLSVEDKVNYARPSIDIMFETAAFAYGSGLIGIILTGANNDGAKGLKAIKEHGGLTIVQDPTSAEVDTMPRSAMELSRPHHVLKLESIAELLNEINRKKI